MAKPVVGKKETEASYKQAEQWAKSAKKVADKGGREGSAGPVQKEKAQEFVNKYKDKVKETQGTKPSSSSSSSESRTSSGDKPLTGLGAPIGGLGAPIKGISSSPIIGISPSPYPAISSSPSIGINPNYRAF